MKTTLVVVALGCAAIAAAAFSIPASEGLECSVTSTSDGRDGPTQTVRYTFLSDNRFVQDDAVGKMLTTSTSFVLGEGYDGPNDFRSDAVVIDKASGRLHWSSHSGDRYVVTTGRCHRVKP